MSPTSSPQVVETYLDDDQTASTSKTIETLSQRYAELRGDARLLNSDIEEGHREVRRWDLDQRASVKARKAPIELLEELAVDRGISWATIANLLRVSVSAVRKWRAGDPPSPERRLQLSRLCAFLDLAEEMPIDDAGAWLAMPVVNGYGVTGNELFKEGLADDLLDYAAGHIDPHTLLDRYDPQWREAQASTWEVVNAPDGMRSIRRRQ